MTMTTTARHDTLTAITTVLSEPETDTETSLYNGINLIIYVTN